jgi:hypothetical protein
VDRIAAAFILQDYLNKKARHGGGAPPGPGGGNP